MKVRPDRYRNWGPVTCLEIRPDRYRNWGPVTCLETGTTYPNPTKAARASGYKTGEMVRMSVMLGKACKGLHFADGGLAGDELEKARHELEMQARQNLRHSVPDEYEIGIPVRILKPGLIDCMPVPARGVITNVDIAAIHPLTVRTHSVPDEYEIGIPVRILKPGLIDCMPVPARGVITNVDIAAIHPLTVRTRAGLVYYLRTDEVQLA